MGKSQFFVKVFVRRKVFSPQSFDSWYKQKKDQFAKEKLEEKKKKAEEKQKLAATQPKK